MIDRAASLKAADKFLNQGRLDAAIAEYVRLVDDQPRDWNAINALGDLYVRAGDHENAAAQFTRIADHLFAEGFFPKAAAVYKKALRVKADDEHTLLRLVDIAVEQDVIVDAKQYLKQLAELRSARGDDRGAAEASTRMAALDEEELETAWLQRPRVAVTEAFDEPESADRLLELAQSQLAASNHAEGRATLTRLLAVAPDRYPAVVQASEAMFAAGQIAAAYGCIEIAVDAALLESEFERAVEILGGFLTHGRYRQALEKLVEVCREAGFESRQQMAEAELELLREPVGADARTKTPIEAPSADAETAPAPRASSLDADVLAEVEQAIGAMSRNPMLQPRKEEPTPPPDLDTVFAQMRADAARRDDGIGDGRTHYERALEQLLSGEVVEAVERLQIAARTPLMRFKASAQLGRVFAQRGELATAVEWFERAAEAPPPTPQDGSAVLYELAGVLERMGEMARALAVLLELEADNPGYRDVSARIEALSRTQSSGGSHA